MTDMTRSAALVVQCSPLIVTRCRELSRCHLRAAGFGPTSSIADTKPNPDLRLEDRRRS
jgi:hypothetical protein